MSLTISWYQNRFAPTDGAEADWQCGELDHDEPPDGQGEGEKYGHSVDHDAEVAVEQEKDCPSIGKLEGKNQISSIDDG